MLLPVVGDKGQAVLARANAVIVGVGALGCASADQLVRAGVGRVTLIDRDVVELTNLQRQTLYTELDARERRPKAVAAAERLASINAEITITPVIADLTSRNATSLLRGASVLVDGTDNFETRLLINDVSVRDAIPYAYAGVVGVTAMWGAFTPGGACLRCVVPEVPAPGSLPTCDTAGVLGAAVQTAASGQCVEVLRILLGQIDPNLRVLTEQDCWRGTRREVRLVADPACVCCGQRRFEFLEGKGSDTAVLCGQNAVQVSPESPASIDLPAMAKKLGALGVVTLSPHMLRASVDGHELTIFADGRAIVKGTTRPEAARALYARLMG